MALRITALDVLRAAKSYAVGNGEAPVSWGYPAGMVDQFSLV